ncbi:DUF3794 domain-containing protein [Crassaminicella thermophila]|uniref:DUF3794 domain-containing protein n=1 Tax=Crassaminicella thermophila TaxID=2599308 RepID=A0A5C0SDD0_CRATE|nr:DUF3794 domain-containing protein [Crassaminicella thermophila]QEK10929.1 DUF3794 domain-containing protein [Crassaminicella thermophila]
MAELIKVPKVIGTGSAQYLSVVDIPFNIPVFEIIDIIKKVEITDCYVVDNKVIINGELNKNIIYKTKEEEEQFDNVTRVCGDVVHCTVTIPFALFVEVPGALEGDQCQIEDAFVEGERDVERDFNTDGTFNTLHEKSIIRVDVKVTRTEQICVETSTECVVTGS